MAARPLILLVDDIPDHAKRYEMGLTQHGYRVHLVNTAAAAVLSARNESPDCAVIDVRLPDITGWDLCRQLKDDDHTVGIPIVILTSEVTENCANESARSGCSAWLTHPTVTDDVVRAVKSVLAQNRSAPRSGHDSVIGLVNCQACGSDRVKATLRLGTIQYYCCEVCGLCWRVERQESVA